MFISYLHLTLRLSRYAVLSDPQKKAEFDTNGVNGVRNTPAYLFSLVFLFPFFLSLPSFFDILRYQDSADLFNMFNSFFGRSPFSNRTT